MTSQVGDTLAIRGRKVLAGEHIPLGPHDSLIDVCYDEARRNFDLVASTACWRNYCADWRLTDERLELVSAKGGFRVIGDNALQATWLTGRLVLPLTDVSTFSGGWYQAPFVERLRVTLDRGVVTSVEQLDWMQAVPSWDPSDKAFKPRRVSW